MKNKVANGVSALSLRGMVEEREKVKRTEKEPRAVTLDVWGSFEKLCNRFDGKERCAKVRPWLSKLEKRLASLTQRQLIILVVAVGFLSLCVGAALGFFLTPYRPAPTPEADLTAPPTTPSPQTVSRVGVLRRFKTPQDGVEFYLEEQDETQVLLDFAGRFDSSFVQKTYEGTTAAIEGTMTKSADGSKDILRVEKIVIKY